jgi:hypothetical protein
MGRIFLSMRHEEDKRGVGEPGTIAASATATRELTPISDLILTELRSREFEVLLVPEDLSPMATAEWINERSCPGDVALEIHSTVFSNSAPRGACVYHIANNTLRKQQAELLLLSLVRRVPNLPNRGTRPETAIGVGYLAFCRQVIPASLVLELGALNSSEDRYPLSNQRSEFALGIADGLAAWSRTIESAGAAQPRDGYAPCYIKINGQIYGEQGILVNGNAWIPIDLADRLSLDLTAAAGVRRLTYCSVVYIKAIDLRDYHIAVSWDAAHRTVALRSILQICPGEIDRLYKVGGRTSEVQLIMFLKNNHEAGLLQFPDIAMLYREEGVQEGINYDIAFSQMCVETQFLRFGSDMKPSQNNFAGLGSIGGSAEGASFASVRLGVRAHIQHLKAYATTEPMVLDIVDPRFHFVARGIAPVVSKLSGRWTADPLYGDKILAVLKRLYESAGLM